MKAVCWSVITCGAVYHVVESGSNFTTVDEIDP